MKGYLYDARGGDASVEVTAQSLRELGSTSLLWLDLEREDSENLEDAAVLLELTEKSLRQLKRPELPRVDNYGTYYQFSVQAAPNGAHTSAARLDFLVGDNWLLTVRDKGIEFLAAFRGQDKADTAIGELRAQDLAASLLDWHLESYFAEAAAIEAAIDRIDTKVLAEPSARSLLTRMLAIRQRISSLRRALSAQRPVFYGLARPDILAGLHTEGAPWAALSARFERSVDTIENLRDHLLGSFELFTSRTGQETNELVKALTFFTVIIGSVAAIAGLFGMNFDPPFFSTGAKGFFAVTGGLLIIAMAAWWWARRRRWI